MARGETILRQIGDRRFVVMTGSKELTDMGDGLRMNLARNKTHANRLQIEYDNGTDTYIMKFYKRIITKKLQVKLTEIAEFE